MERIRLAEGVRTRREFFGGLVYDSRTGTTLELDRGALRLLELARGGVHLDAAHALIREERLEPDLRREEMIAMAGELCGLGVLRSCSEAHQTSAPVSAGIWPSTPYLTAPEAVHWAVTYRCEADCSYCYAARRKDTGGELTTSRALAAIDAFAEWGVFQLAIGGGEPLVRNDLDALVRHAAGRGLSVHMTTGGDHLTPSRIAILAGALTCLQIGVRHHDLLHDPPGTQAQRLRTICDTARDNDLAVGANLILCRTTLR
ncbi:MAG: radical SAM protein, partial [Dehalococcoidia bacterium]|nr:radical SAM protein [Dehalococcoidia bacterium]